MIANSLSQPISNAGQEWQHFITAIKGFAADMSIWGFSNQTEKGTMPARQNNKRVERTGTTTPSTMQTGGPNCGWVLRSSHHGRIFACQRFRGFPALCRFFDKFV